MFRFLINLDRILVTIKQINTCRKTPFNIPPQYKQNKHGL